jgi:hypothetical protein
MTRATILLITFVGLVAACGVDGEPKTPPAKKPATAPSPGISVSGSASVGVVGGSG